MPITPEMLINGELKSLTEMYKSLSTRLEAQHEFKLRQIDENRKLSRRLDELEEALKRDFITITERIDSGFAAHLESDEYADEQIRERFMKMNKRIAEIEKVATDYLSAWNLIDERISSLEGKLNEVYTKTMGIIPGRKQPYKCPVCEGRKTHVSLAINKARDHAFVHDNCICCEGTGIVWG
jgi:DNA repair exonuclease SbcCD ATPase subunit